MASGLPIATSPVNGIPYEMKEPENGFFSNYGDIEKLKNNILKIIDHPKLAKEIAQNNLEKSKNFDWDIIYERFMKEYRELIEKPSKNL